MPTATDWSQAVYSVYETYPPDVFPPDSDSPDAKAGTWARKVCLNIVAEAWRLRTDRIDGPGIDPRQQAQDEWRVGTALKNWRPKGDLNDGCEGG